jgi:hypothetical protein
MQLTASIKRTQNHLSELCVSHQTQYRVDTATSVTRQSGSLVGAVKRHSVFSSGIMLQPVTR